MITDGTSTGLTEQRARQVFNANSLQIITAKLSSPSVQERLKSLRQEHRQVHVALDTFH
jgi:hypothetical protein